MPKPKKQHKLSKNTRIVPKKLNQGLQRRWLGLALGGVAIVSATVGAIMAVYLGSKPLQQHQFSPEEASEFNGDSLTSSGLQLPSLNRPVNILVMGMSVLPSDMRNPPPETKKLSYEPQMHSVDAQSDTMMLLRFDPEKRNMTVLSIPRDTRIVMEKNGVQKINAPIIIGGPSLAAKEVSRLLEGIAIDRYVSLNVLGVGKLIDILGGLTIDVPEDMKYTDYSQHLFINLKKGKQHLNGEQLMNLLEYRQDLYGDLGRMQRQQMVIRALMSQLLTPSTVVKIPKLLEAIKSDLDTNLSVQEMMTLAGFAAHVDRDHVQGLIVPGDFNGNGKHGTSYWLPDRHRLQVMMEKYFDQGYGGNVVVDQAHIRVSIQDSTHNPSAVQSLVKMLSKAGYDRVSIGATLPEPLPETKIVAQNGDTDGADSINQTLGFGQVSVETSGTLYSDVTIQLGSDALPKLAEFERLLVH